MGSLTLLFELVTDAVEVVLLTTEAEPEVGEADDEEEGGGVLVDVVDSITEAVTSSTDDVGAVLVEVELDPVVALTARMTTAAEELVGAMLEDALPVKEEVGPICDAEEISTEEEEMPDSVKTKAGVVDDWIEVCTSEFGVEGSVELALEAFV